MKEFQLSVEWGKKKASYMWYFHLKCITLLQSQENTRQTQIEAHFTEQLTHNLCTCQDHDQIGKTEEMWQTGGD